jgi:flagellar hook-basal body complex protein FliE
MSPISTVTSAMNPIGLTGAPNPIGHNLGGSSNVNGASFSSTIQNLISDVSGKEAQAEALTNNVILGQSSQLHQSVIAMQEASVSLSLMVQVRNKLVESYQELMRMPV